MNGLRRVQERADGQIIVIAALGMVAMIAMVALIVDGGWAWTQGRNTQNAADATAEAGAVVLLEHMIAPSDASLNDAAVAAALDATAAHNETAWEVAYYTDLSGALLRADGSTTSDQNLAVEVGSGTIPPCLTNCAGADASGVHLIASRTFDTFFAKIIGFPQLTAREDATAISGYVSNPCQSAEGCALVPVTVPVTVVTCDNNNEANPGDTQYVKDVHYVIPLCNDSPGNVGWIDWEPPPGGASELAAEIRNPTPRLVAIPEWYFVSETGNVNAKQVEDALNQYAGQAILIPMFDSTCNIDPPTAAVEACPAGNVGGNGVNQWYHFPQFGAFLLDDPKGAYLTGNDSAVCDAAGGNGATSCLTGKFVDFWTEGEVGVPPQGSTTTNAFYGVQLID